MKKLLTLFLALSVCAATFASGNALVLPASKPAKVKASDVMIPIGKTGKTISLLDLSQLKVKELEALTGEKMNLSNRIGFKLAQRELARSIDADGTLNSKKMAKLAARAGGESGGFHMGGFALGFFLGLIGVLIAYLINDELKHDRVKWAWLGWGIFVVLYVILLVALL